jgi:hypothetical protein
MPSQVNSYSLWLAAQQNPICPKSGPTGPTGPVGPQGIPGSATSYEPATSGNWDAPIPTTIEDALDQLAARVKVLETP